MTNQSGTNFAIGLCAAAIFLIILLKGYMSRKSKYSKPGSVADLVRRGQLRSDRRGMYDSNLPGRAFLCEYAYLLIYLFSTIYRSFCFLLPTPQIGLFDFIV